MSPGDGPGDHVPGPSSVHGTRPWGRPWAALLARLLLGLMFGMAGWWKVTGLGALTHARQLFVEPYADTLLPTWALWVAGTTIPWVELAAGALVTVGFLRRPAYLSLGAVLVVVTFGHLLAEPLYAFHQHVVPRAALLAFLLWTPLDVDRFSVDGWRGS